VIGRDSGELAGLGQNGIAVTTDLAPLLAKADALSIHGAGCDACSWSLPRRVISSAPRRHRRDDALIAQARRRTTVVKSGNMSLGRQSAGALGQAGGEDARPGFVI